MFLESYFMMQSILLNSANKAQASERLPDAPTSETKSESTKQQRTCFSDVLGVALQETEGNEVKALHVAHSAEVDTNIDGELLADTLSAESFANNVSVENLGESTDSQGLQSSDELQDSDELEDLGGIELPDNNEAPNIVEDKQSLANAARLNGFENEQVFAASESIQNAQATADGAASENSKNVQAMANDGASESIKNIQGQVDDVAGESTQNIQGQVDVAASENNKNGQGLVDGAVSERIKNAQGLIPGDNVANADGFADPVNKSADIDPSLVFGKVAPNNKDNIKESKPDGVKLDDLTEVPQETGTPEILAQIQAAQKIDTQVNEPAKAAEESLAPLAGLKKAAEKEAAHIEQSAAASSALTDEESTESIIQKETKAESLQTTEGKLQAFAFTNSSNEISPHTLSAAIDGTGLSSVNMNSTNLDKVINQNVHNTLPLAAQNPALDLQAKHASALLGERVLMMISEGKQEVQIRLDPAELGSMLVKLQVQQDQLHLTIQTQVGQSRDIIEQHLPKLREQLAQQGVNLGEANVEQQNQQQQQQNQQQKNAIQHNSARLASDSALPSSSEKTEWQASSIALPSQGVDYYA